MKLTAFEKLFIESPFRTRLLRKREAPEVLAHLPYLGGCRCLELGCGSGAGALIIKHYTGCDTLMSVDIDPAMVKRARRYTAHTQSWNANISRYGISFAVEDAQHLSFESGDFDAVVHFFVLDHIAGWRNVVAEVHRVLRPGGVWAFEDALLPDSPFMLHGLFGHIPIGEKELRGALDGAGFSIENMTIHAKRCFVSCRKQPGTDTVHSSHHQETVM